ncbi:MAG: pyruvate kinase [Calditrichaeota bacterium]|nr:pyruvate kinase [Calditrichota bacterium]
MKRAKIIATLGPASNSPEIIQKLIQTGVDVVRLNFSHGTHDEHARMIQIVRNLSKKLNRPIGILQDLQGPKIRVGPIKDGHILLKDGQKITITTEPLTGTTEMISTTYKHLPKDVSPGDRILLDDGLLELRVTKTADTKVICEVIHGGPLGSHKGINLPGVKLSTPSLTEKDKIDLKFGIEQKVDFVALSFVRTPLDVAELKKLIEDEGTDIPVIAKLEKPEAIENLDDILSVADAAMVARGDLGVEMNPEKVPIIQKDIIRKCIEKSIPVITATQMLESMRFQPRPTRAEASDVANAIFDGTDAVMLSAETAAGEYPVESVQMMRKIIEEAEQHSREDAHPVLPSGRHAQKTFPDSISEAACEAALELNARAIVAFTQSGFTARLISKYRPSTQIVAFTLSEKVRHRLLLNWGTTTRKIDMINSLDEMIQRVEKALLSDGLVTQGDSIVIVSGAPLGVKGTTNMMTLHRIGRRT